MTQSKNEFQVATSRILDPKQAADELLSQTPDAPDVAILFASHHYVELLSPIASRLANRFGERLIGCTGESIVAGDIEVEEKPILVLWTASIEGAEVDVCRLRFRRKREGGGIVTGWPAHLPESWPSDTTLIALTEPYSFPADVMLSHLNEDQPTVTVIGGVASGGTGPGESKLIWGPDVLSDGGLGLMLRNAEVTTVVSQGCRPIGEPFVITKAEQNVIYQLGGKRAHDQLKSVYERLPNRDKELLRSGIHLGRVVNEYQEEFDYGDFLIRHVSGFDPNDGSLVVGDYMRVGQTVQFHVRDATTAGADLQQLLSSTREEAEPFQGALLFTCNGRGTRLFDTEHHDARMLASVHGGMSTAGFFCQGEMGPVGGKNFLHGFTASIALFK